MPHRYIFTEIFTASTWYVIQCTLAALRSGNGVGRVNDVTLWSSPVSTGMGDVSGFDSRRLHFISVCNQPPRSTRPFILSRSIN